MSRRSRLLSMLTASAAVLALGRRGLGDPGLAPLRSEWLAAAADPTLRRIVVDSLSADPGPTFSP